MNNSLQHFMSNCIMPPWGVVGREFRGSDYCLRFQEETLSKLPRKLCAMLFRCSFANSRMKQHHPLLWSLSYIRPVNIISVFHVFLCIARLSLNHAEHMVNNSTSAFVSLERIHDCVWISYKNSLVCFVLGPKLWQVPGVCMEFSAPLLVFSVNSAG